MNIFGLSFVLYFMYIHSTTVTAGRKSWIRYFGFRFHVECHVTFDVNKLRKFGQDRHLLSKLLGTMNTILIQISG